MVFSSVERYRTHLSLIRSLSRNRVPSSSRMYCSPSSGRPDSLHPPLRCLYHPLISPARVCSSNSLAYTSRYRSTPTWITSFTHLHVARYECHAGISRGDPSCTVDLALFLPVQACSNSIRVVSSSNHPGRRGFGVRRGTGFSAPLKRTSAKFVAGELTVLPVIL